MLKTAFPTAFSVLIAVISLCACESVTTQKINYVPLNRVAADNFQLMDDASLRIIGYSGGEDKENNKLYYYQFLTVSEKGDTIRVLCPALTIPGDGESEVTHTSPQQFNAQKNVFEALFKNIDSSDNQMLRLMALPAGQAGVSEKITAALQGTDPEEVLIVNESIPSFDRPGYKTVRGILHFDVVPW